jgi:hypothetical protein
MSMVFDAALLEFMRTMRLARRKSPPSKGPGKDEGRTPYPACGLLRFKDEESARPAAISAEGT